MTPRRSRSWTTSLITLPPVLRDPEEPLSTFVGEAANGTWELKICDDGFGDVGTFNSATLTLASPGPADGPSLCGSSPMQLTWHNAILTTKDGIYHWGKASHPDGDLAVDVLVPTLIDPENGYDFTGDALIATLGAGNSENPQHFLLSTEGLYVWGEAGNVIPDTLTSGDEFQEIALPDGVAPEDVQLMVAAGNPPGFLADGGGLVILTNSGDVYVLSNDFYFYGDGSASADTDWHQASIGNVVDLVNTGDMIFAVTDVNDYYTWGSGIYDGSGSGLTSSATPVLMSAPFSGTAVSIAATNGSYYALNPDGTVSVLGENKVGELGIGTTTAQTTWTTMLNPDGTGPMTDVVFLNASSNDSENSAVGIITSDHNLYLTGSNSSEKLGLPAGTYLLPTAPTGVSSATHDPVGVFPGTHTTAFFDGDTGKYCYAGHKDNGSMGDGSAADETIAEFNCDSTPVFNDICTEFEEFSDAPVSYNEGDPPSHPIFINPTLYLGAIPPDSELAAIPTDAADGDNADNNDDEDGVTFRSPAGSNHSIFADVTIVNESNGRSVTACCWLDVPTAGGSVDDVFGASDGQCQSTTEASTTLTFQWSGLPIDQAYDTYARCRITSYGMTTADATGAADDGEVEDYALSFDFTPTAVTIGDVALESLSVEDYLNSAALDQLQVLLASFGKDADDMDSAALIAALTEFLDPDGDGQVALLHWDTLEERGTIGFYVERQNQAQSDGQDWSRVNNDLLPGMITAPMGAEYRLLDPGAQPGTTYQYRLIELEATGNTRSYGSFELQMQ